MLRGNKLLLALLLPVFVLSLCLAAFALDEDDFIIIDGQHLTPEQWAEKQAMGDASVKNLDAPVIPLTPRAYKPGVLEFDGETLPFKYEQGTNPLLYGTPTLPSMSGLKVNLMEADFNDGIFPPSGWTLQQLGDVGANTWELDDGAYVYEGPYGAVIGYDAYNNQDEWLISPSVTLTTGTTWYLDFAWITGYVWMVNPYDNAEMVVRVTTDGGTTWDSLWCEDDQPVFPDYASQWTDNRVEHIDLSAYDGETIQVAFHYYGLDADGFFLDYISINDGVAPDGRCCYGNSAAPSCADMTQADCEALADFISWTAGTDCATDPCPTAPANDLCADAEVLSLPATVSASNVAGQNVDCPGLLDWNAVWYEFTLTSTDDCSNLEVDFTATIDPIYSVGVIIMDDCACDDYILYSGIEWVGGERPIITWRNVPDGTYYFPAMAVADASDTPMDFVFTMSAVDCPPAPPNDLCTDAIPLTLPATVQGSNISGQNVDCPGLLDWNAVWYEFTLSATNDCSNLTVDYTATTQTIYSVGVIIMDDCACDDYILYNNIEWISSRPIIYWNYVPNGTYYFPAMCDQDGNDTPMDFEFTMSAVECPPAQPGDNCGDPLKVNISGPGFGGYTDANYTCGRGNNESSTCMSLYDGGEDIFYEINVAADVCLKFTLDPQGTTYTGMALGAACPPPGTTYSDCLAEVTDGSGSPKGFFIDLTAGTYYLMIDTWPAPDCIPAFDLTIEECPPPTPGDNCSDPLKVNLPADAPYSDIGQYTCGRVDDYDQTCLSYYDGGEDIIYEINVDDAGYYEFIHDPKGTTWTGMGLGDTCPLSGTTYSDCIAEATDYSSSPHGFIVFLMPGTYYLHIDTWPSPDCIPDFDLFINYLAPPQLDWDMTLIEFCNQAPDQNGCVTLNLSNLGDVDLNYSITYEYGVPQTKEIDGANIVVDPTQYIPGGSGTFTFTCTNASSDTEWIDSVAITFPAGVTVTGSTDMDVVGQTRYLEYDGTTGDGVTVSFGNWNGGYGNIYSTDVAEADISLSFDAGLSGPLTIDYHISGDEWGSPPHDVNGSVMLNTGNPLENWLSVDVSGGVIGPQGNQAVQVCFNSAGLPDGDTYFASLIITHDGGLSPITIPIVLQLGDDHDPAAVVAIDKSGSMALTDAFGETRFDRAKALAHTDVDDLLTNGYMVSVVSFNGSQGIVVQQDFTTDGVALHDAIDAIVDPRHDTPLAAAMCQAHCTLHQLGCGVDAIYTYTDGEENQSLDYDMCYICDLCYAHHETGWNYDCDPNNPASCTDWQLCLADIFADNGVNIVNYFGAPVNPFAGKSGSAPEDLYFLKYTADASDGEFHYFADAAYVPGDANGDGGLNVSDAVYILNYVFVAGDEPQPLEAADANCDGDVNVSDAVSIINFVFAGGDAPVLCE